MSKRLTTGRRILQMIPTPEGWCLTLDYGAWYDHFPVIAWAIVEDDGEWRDLEGDDDQRIMPVYLDEGSPQVIWPTNPLFQNCRMAVHRLGECLEAERDLEAAKVITITVRDPDATP